MTEGFNSCPVHLCDKTPYTCMACMYVNTHSLCLGRGNKFDKKLYTLKFRGSTPQISILISGVKIFKFKSL